MTTARKSSRSTGRKSRSIKTSETVEDTIWRPLTLSAAGSHANLFRLRVDGKLKPILAGSGRSSPVSSVSYDLSTSSWRTSPDSTAPEVQRSSLILPRAGMMRNGTLYLRRPSVPRISVTVSSLWPTPSATDWKRTPMTDYYAKREIQSLPTAVCQQCHCGTQQHRIEPRFVEWMMGFPLGWTDLEHSETL